MRPEFRYVCEKDACTTYQRQIQRQIQRFKRATTQIGVRPEFRHVCQKDACTTCQRWWVPVLKFDGLLAIRPVFGRFDTCLLYTSDAADE